MKKGNGNSSKMGKRNEKTRRGFTAIVASPDEFISQKDTNKWFSVPMNDRIAPGYSDKVK